MQHLPQGAGIGVERKMHILQLFRCVAGHHVRSHRRSHFVDGVKVSVCRGCGRKMIKDDLAWGLLNADNEAPAPNASKR
jgi:hypothetical protein